MSQIRSKDTKVELALRSALWNEGYRFRKNYRKLPGSPDIVFVRKKIAIFVDGDFWHGNNWRLRRLKRRSDEFAEDKRDYWLNKIKTNIKRDKKNTKELEKAGYCVMRFWESDVKKDVKSVFRTIEKNYQRRHPSL